MKIKYLFLIIIFVAIFLRFYNLGTNPPSLTWDEVAWGYNAYSFGVDGRDEFGKFLPLAYLESFGDFKPPLYAYLDIIPVKVFGLTEFATRFPSAFFGVLTVILTFFLVKEIYFPLQKKTLFTLALLSPFLLTISPWHILLSRAAFEANVASFFIVLGIYLFIYSVKRNSWLLVFSILSFTLSMYTFNTARVVAPILLLGLLIGTRKEIVSKLKGKTIVSAIIGGIVFLPLFLFLIQPQAALRFKEVNIFSDASIVERANQQIENDGNAFWSKIIHNRRVGYSLEYLKHYFDNLDPQFLFIKGDGNPKFSIQDVGQLYMWEIPFFLSGIFIIFRKRYGFWWIIPFWLLVGIIPAGTARETPHALRTEVILPTIQIITAFGLYYIIKNVKEKYKGIPVRNSVIAILVLAVVFNFVYFYHNYFTHYPKEFSGEWQYGYKEAVNYVESVRDKYEKVVFTTELGRPYIYFLFYEKYQPQRFREEAEILREPLGFVHVEEFSNIEFRKDVSSVKDGRILFVDVPGRVPPNVNILKTFKLLSGQEALVAYEK